MKPKSRCADGDHRHWWWEWPSATAQLREGAFAPASTLCAASSFWGIFMYNLVSSKWCENGQYLPHLQYMCIENTIPIIQYQYISISTVSVGSSFSSLMNQWIGWLDGGPYPSTIHNAAGAPPNWWSMNQNKTIKSHCVQEFGVPKKVARNEITKWIQMIHSLLFTLLIE